MVNDGRQGPTERPLLAQLVPASHHASPLGDRICICSTTRLVCITCTGRTDLAQRQPLNLGIVLVLQLLHTRKLGGAGQVRWRTLRGNRRLVYQRTDALLLRLQGMC